MHTSHTSTEPSSLSSRLRSAHSSPHKLSHAPTPPSSPRGSSGTETNKQTSSLGGTIVGIVTDNVIDHTIVSEGKVHHVESVPKQVSEFPCKIYHDLHQECVRRSSEIITNNCSTALYNYNECLHQKYI